jgi:2-oxoisovalerate dehydrogenase E1 component
MRMAVHRRLEPAAPWVELVATQDDWDAADRELLTTMLGQLVVVRVFEEYVLELASAGPSSP